MRCGVTCGFAFRAINPRAVEPLLDKLKADHKLTLS